MKNNLASKGITKRVALILSLLVIGLVILIRVRLLAVPLERDEGEYAYAGQLMLDGIPPYKLAYSMKFSGIYAAYALIMAVFGQTITGIHLGLLLVNSATVAVIFLLGRRLTDEIGGSVAAASYALLSVSPSVLGSAAHATHFVMLPVLAGTFLLLEPHPMKRVLASGALFGIGLLMKQPACLFVLFGAIYLFIRHLGAGLGMKQAALRNLLFITSAIVPLTIACLLLWHAGVFNKFWFWTIDYAREYGTIVPAGQLSHFFVPNVQEVIGPGWILWIVAGVGALAALWDGRTRASIIFLLAFLFFSVLALSPGFYFRYHYFIFVLPAVSLLAGVAISKWSDVLSNRMIAARFIPLLLFSAALALPIFKEKRFFFEASPVEACQIVYPQAPFAESVRIAEYVRDHTSSQDVIAVLGSEPQIYFYAQRHSATGYIYTYPLMEPQKYARQMQEEMIREIEGARPKYLISVIMNDSWLRRPHSDGLIFTWANEYTAQNYAVAGFVNMVASGQTDYYFANIPQSVPRLGNYILIYERKS